MPERKPEIKDTDSEVTPARDDEVDHDYGGDEVSPEDIADELGRNPFMEREEETLPPDFPLTL